MSLAPEGLDTEHYVAGICLLALVALVAIGRGFRGVSMGGVSVGIK